MALCTEALAAFAFVHQIHGLLEGRGPVESMAECFGHQGSGGVMMPTLPLVDVSENLLPFF